MLQNLQKKCEEVISDEHFLCNTNFEQVLANGTAVTRILSFLLFMLLLYIVTMTEHFLTHLKCNTEYVFYSDYGSATCQSKCF